MFAAGAGAFILTIFVLVVSVGFEYHAWMFWASLVVFGIISLPFMLISDFGNHLADRTADRISDRADGRERQKEMSRKSRRRRKPTVIIDARSVSIDNRSIHVDGKMPKELDDGTQKESRHGR